MCMKRRFTGLLALVLIAATGLLVAGCGGAPSKAVTRETWFDFGDVPVVTDMAGTRYKDFAIANEGTGDLKLSDIQVKLLEGC